MTELVRPTVDLGEGLQRVLARVNAYRRAGRICEGWTVAEQMMDLLFDTSKHLAVYGSLAPGEANHYVIDGMPGTWYDGTINGVFYDQGWGARIGFPALRWMPRGKPIPVQLFVSDGLEHDWGRIDAFEGFEYQRVLAPLYDDDGFLGVANIYEVR